MDELKDCPFCGFSCGFNDMDGTVECSNDDCGCIFEFTGLYYFGGLCREEAVTKAFNSRVFEEEYGEDY